MPNFHKHRAPTFAHYALLIVGAMLAMQRGSISVDVPPILSNCFTPLGPSEASKWAEELHKGKLPLHNVTKFCREAGFLCDEQIEAPSTSLFSFSTYRLIAHTKVEAHFQAYIDSLFFKESLLSLGTLLQLPSFQEPPIPTRAFLPPLLQPLLFNPPTSLLPHVLPPFGVHPDTPLGLSMQETLHLCNSPPTHHEAKACVATFEDMLHFATSAIGTTDVAVISNPILPPQQIVTVMALEEVTLGGERVAVSCHNMMFPFQVFYCHNIKGTKVFKATLQMEVGDSRMNISALASCHPLEPSLSHSLAYMKLSEGELLCHWNAGDNIVWTPF